MRARQKEVDEMVGERVSLARQALDADTAVQEATRKLDEARKGGSDAEARVATRALKKAEFDLQSASAVCPVVVRYAPGLGNATNNLGL